MITIRIKNKDRRKNKKNTHVSMGAFCHCSGGFVFTNRCLA